MNLVETIRLYLVLLLYSMSNIVSSIKPYVMQTVVMDSFDSSSTSLNLVKGLRGYIYSHDQTVKTYRPDKRYLLTIEAPEHYQIAIEAIYFNLGYPKDSRKCLLDSLFLFNNQPDLDDNPTEITSKLGEMINEYCNVNNRTLLGVSAKNSITLYWHTVSMDKRYPNSKGFLLKWTTFRSLPYYGSCSSETEFSCSNRQSCIPAELACDTIADCKDESDLDKNLQRLAGCENIEEDTDSLTDSFSGSAIAGIIIGLLLALALIVAIIVCCFNPNRNKQTNFLNSKSATLEYKPAQSDYRIGHVCKNTEDLQECRQKLNQSNVNVHGTQTHHLNNQNHIYFRDKGIV